MKTRIRVVDKYGPGFLSSYNVIVCFSMNRTEYRIFFKTYMLHNIDLTAGGPQLARRGDQVRGRRRVGRIRQVGRGAVVHERGRVAVVEHHLPRREHGGVGVPVEPGVRSCAKTDEGKKA